MQRVLVVVLCDVNRVLLLHTELSSVGHLCSCTYCNWW